MELDLFKLLHENAILLLFVTIGLGFIIGRIRIRGISAGSTAGVLIAGLWLGHAGLAIDPIYGTMGFYLFMYTVGLAAGPRFFGVIRRAGLKYLSMAAVVSGSGFLIAYRCTEFLSLEPGVGAGMLAGALTSTPTLAAATDAIQQGIAQLPQTLSPEQASENIVVAYALTYGFGMIGLILLLRMMPRIFRFKLREEARIAAKEMKMEIPSEESPTRHGAALIEAYEVAKENLVGKSLKELNLGRNYYFTVARIKRDGQIATAETSSTLQLGDRVTVICSVAGRPHAGELLGPRIQDADMLDAQLDSAEIVITKERAVEASLEGLNLMGQAGLWVAKVVRSQISLPIEPGTILQRGDVITVWGLRPHIRQIAANYGVIEAEVTETDLPTFAAGVAAGLFVGNFNIKLRRGNITLGPAGGLLFAGIVAGFLRSLYPTFGRVPESARWVIRELGLLFFMASVGLRAGAGIGDNLTGIGLPVILCGAAITIIPALIGFIFGRWVLKLNPALVLGGICGAMTSTPALGMINHDAESEVPAIGYAGTYTFANVFLTVAGSALMRM